MGVAGVVLTWACAVSSWALVWQARKRRPSQPVARLSPTDRLVAALCADYVAGRIDVTELEQRVDDAYFGLPHRWWLPPEDGLSMEERAVATRKALINEAFGATDAPGQVVYYRPGREPRPMYRV